jgi:SAM-dependent methyltransferase
MTNRVKASIYDYPKYYDLLFGSDWKAEFDFFVACFAKHAGCKVKRVFEPACGTGRLLIRLAKAGYRVGGNDLNPKAVDYCNQRLHRHGFENKVVVGDMSDFTVKKKFQGSFNTINSFRHLGTEQAAVDHLSCMAGGLSKGGLYILGIHLEPTTVPPMTEESWSARRGDLVVNSHMWSKGIDRDRRIEHLGITIDVHTPTKHIMIEDHMEYRTYKRGQFASLLKKVPELEVAAIYDFAYDVTKPHTITSASEDVVYVLRKRSK